MNIANSNWDLLKDETMVQAVRHARVPLCITDPNMPDNPIVFANQAFLDLTGYQADEVIGRNCRFLQGEDTSPASIAAVRRIIEERKVDTVEILNYRKDGSVFLNALQMGPIMDESGAVKFFFGSQMDISAKRALEQQARELADKELLHRLKNIVNVMSVIIRLTAREEAEAGTLAQRTIGRLTALSEAHFHTIPGADGPEIGVGQLAFAILDAYSAMGERQFRLSGPDRPLPAGMVSAVALVLHELATNAVKHGALSSPEGVVEFDWEFEETPGQTAIAFRWTEKNGPEVVPPTRRSGSTIATKLVATLGGSLDFDWRPGGLVATASLATPS